MVNFTLVIQLVSQEELEMTTKQAFEIVKLWLDGKREYDSVTVLACRILRG